MIRKTLHINTILVVAIALSGASSAANADSMTYKIIDIGSLPGSTKEAEATGLNRTGDVIGWSNGSPFIYSNSVLARTSENANAISDNRLIAIPTSNFSPLAINSSGEMAGQSGTTPAIDSKGVVTLLPGVGNGYAFGINDAGQVVGSMSYNSFGQYPDTTHAFLYSDGKVIDLARSPGEYSEARGINELGQVVGTSGPLSNSNMSHPFIYSNGTYTDLPFFGRAVGINDLGAVLGYSNSGNGIERGFLYQNGVKTDLTTLIQSLGKITLGQDSLIGINDSGQILFNATVDGNSHAFLLTPQAVPEPTTLAFGMCVGVTFVIRHLKKRRPVP